MATDENLGEHIGARQGNKQAAPMIMIGALAVALVACQGVPVSKVGEAPPCVAGPPPTAQAAYQLADAFPELPAFLSPVAMIHPPGDDSVFTVVEQNGLVYSFSNSAAVSEKTLVADLSESVTSPSDFDFESHFETGLVGAAYSPRFETDRTLFLSFTAPSGVPMAPLDLVIARFVVDASGQTSIAASEDVLRIPQRTLIHHSGTLVFGPDDMLYIAVGDDQRAAQAREPDNLWGKVLRIDVLSTTPYAIPPDNPFLSPGDRGELFAVGMRNPWKFSFDSQTGELWLGDVGEKDWEEINLITSGGNYGWPTFEGKVCRSSEERCSDPNLIAPVLAYPHDRLDRSELSGNSVTGGFVYRGTRLSELVGTYVFADYVAGRLWSLELDEESPVQSLLIDNSTRARYSSLTEDTDGELWAIDYQSGRILSLELASTEIETVELPLQLSDTGCITPGRRPAVEYVVNSPFWSDGASKRRWLRLPEGTELTRDPDGQLTAPVGAVFVKEFQRDGRLLETRLFVRHTDGSHAGYSYAWNEDQTNAELVGANEERVIETAPGPWRIPTRTECLQCHTAGAKFLLGLELAQLDQVASGGAQLEKLVADGVLEPLTEPGPAPLVAADSEDPAVETAARARSYLHSNCSGCHRPSAALARTAIDFRAHDGLGDPIPLSAMNLCNIGPSTDYRGNSSADRLLAPGSADRSILLQRMEANSEMAHRMPPIGSDRVDPTGLDVVGRWIEGVANCE